MRCLMWFDTAWACWAHNVISQMIMPPDRCGLDPGTPCNCFITLNTAPAVCHPTGVVTSKHPVGSATEGSTRSWLPACPFVKDLGWHSIFF